MLEWSKEIVENLLRDHPVTARLRFSTSADLAQLDIYYKDFFETRPIEEKFERRGWALCGHHIGLPAGVRGFFYRHASVNAQRYRRTREQLLEVTGSVAPTSEILNVERERHAPPTVSSTVYDLCFRVVEVDIESGRCDVIGHFHEQPKAQRLANATGDGRVRLIYMNDRFVGGVSWTPLPNEAWYTAREIAER